MTKVGIITMHRVLNCGSALQAYATQYMIEKLGYEPQIIDYQFPNVYQFERGIPYYPLTWKSKIARTFSLTSDWRKVDRFERFYKKFFKLSPSFDSPLSVKLAPPIYDIYMTGSDQVWNTEHTKGDTTFLLDFVEHKKKIAYAASFASDVLEEQFVSSFKSLLPSYDAISVREVGGKKIIKELLGRDASIVLDPTLLLDADEWSKLSDACTNSLYKKKEYILVYKLDYAFDSSSIIYDVIRKIQAQTSYDIVSIGKLDDSKVGKYKAILETGPLEFLRLFRNASCVVTSSFHGTAFAVNFRKKLFPVCPSLSHDDRQATLLKSLGIAQCIIPSDMDINALDIVRVAETSKQGYSRLQELRKESIACLEQMLSGCLSYNN